MGLKYTLREVRPSKVSWWLPGTKISYQIRGLISRYRCGRVDCEDEYIGKSPRTFGERFNKYLKTPSSIYDHCNTTGHTTAINNFSIVGRRDKSLARAIKESIYIRVNSPSLIRTLASTIYLTFGMRFCLTHQYSN